MQVTLTKLSDNQNSLRSNSVVGYTAKMPTLGERFTMYAEGFSDPNLLRMVETSPVREIEEGSPVKHDEVFHYFFKTENSRYQLATKGNK